MSKPTPTARSMTHLRAAGWTVGVVEQRIPNTNITRDLFGFIDLVAIRGPVTMGVQVTSGSNVAARIRKIAEAEHVGAVRQAGWKIVVHGWRRSARSGDWVLRIVDLS
jgi:hypothetical protein